MKAKTTSQALQTLGKLTKDYRQKLASMEKEKEKISQNRDLRIEAIRRKQQEIDQQISAEKLATQKLLAKLRTEYEKSVTDASSVISLSEAQDPFILTRSEINVLQSLDYIPFGKGDWERLAQSIDASVTPALAAAVQAKARQAGYEISGLYTSPDEKMQQFDRLLNMCNQIVDPSGSMADGVEFYEVMVYDEIQTAADAACPFDDSGNPKPSAVTVKPIPQTMEEAVIADLTTQAEQQQELSTAEKVEIAEAFDMPEIAQTEIMAEGIAAAREIMMDRDEPSKIDQTSKDVIDFSKSGQAVE